MRRRYSPEWIPTASRRHWYFIPCRYDRNPKPLSTTPNRASVRKMCTPIIQRITDSSFRMALTASAKSDLVAKSSLVCAITSTRASAFSVAKPAFSSFRMAARESIATVIIISGSVVVGPKCNGTHRIRQGPESHTLVYPHLQDPLNVDTLDRHINRTEEMNVDINRPSDRVSEDEPNRIAKNFRLHADRIADLDEVAKAWNVTKARALEHMIKQARQHLVQRSSVDGDETHPTPASFSYETTDPVIDVIDCGREERQAASEAYRASHATPKTRKRKPKKEGKKT